MPHDPLPSPDECPDPTLLAAWCEDRVSGEERDALDVHIAQCSLCAELIAELTADLQHGIAGSIALGSIAPGAIVERAIDLVPTRGGWRFVASGVAAAIAVASLGCWIGYRLGAQASQSSAGSSGGESNLVASSSAATSYGLIDDTANTTDASDDPLELVASRLLDRSTS